jgi:hypothetical protein
MKTHRALLPQGTLARASNTRLVDRSAATRPGTVLPVFANVMIDFLAIRGSGLYSNPNGEETLLIAADTRVWRVRDGSAPLPVELPAGESTGGHAEFVQAFDKVLLFRGLDYAPLVWDGIAPEGFAAIAKSKDDLTYLDVIPNAVTAEIAGNRALVPFDKDKVAVSDILDYTIYDKDLAWTRLNTGTSDSLVRIFPYSQANVIVFKGQSIAHWANFNDPATVALQDLDRGIGLIGRKTPQIAGDGILFLSNPSGVRRIRSVNGKLEVDPIPVSDAIDPVIRRINWAAAGQAVSAIVGNYYFLAVPLDGSQVNNALLVLNTVVWNAARGRLGYSDADQIPLPGWESAPDQWAAAFQIDNLLVHTYLGKKALYAIDQAAPAVYVLNVDGATTDTLKDGEHQITTIVESRGYGRGQEGQGSWKNFRRASVSVATLNPSLSITAITDGVNEERALTAAAITRNRTKYFTWAMPDFVTSNVNGDFLAPKREDYTVSLADAPLTMGTGIVPGLKQESTERLPVALPGRWLSIRLTNAQGQCDVRAMSAVGLPARETRRAA